MHDDFRGSEMKLMGFFLAAISAIIALSGGILAHAETLPQTLFVNVHVFDGVSETRLENANVLVEGNLIKQVSRDSIEAPGVDFIGLESAPVAQFA
jgi:hypothetical protein